MFARKATKGIVEHDFVIKKIPFKMVDVGGQRSQRQKWFQCFDGITSILFMVSSSEYDQVAFWAVFWFQQNLSLIVSLNFINLLHLCTKLSLWLAVEAQRWQRFNSTVI